RSVHLPHIDHDKRGVLQLSAHRHYFSWSRIHPEVRTNDSCGCALWCLVAAQAGLGRCIAAYRNARLRKHRAVVRKHLYLALVYLGPGLVVATPDTSISSPIIHGAWLGAADGGID